jgi:hypothetical protein
LEGLRRLNTFNGRSDKSSQKAPLRANGFSSLSERERFGRPVGLLDIYQRDDGLFQLGLNDDAAGPFRTRDFAAAVAAKEVLHAGSA